MASVAGFRVVETLYGSGTTTVYRAIRTSDDSGVVLKWLSQPAPDVAEIGRFRHAWAITRDLDLPGVCRTLGVTEHEGRPVLVMDDPGGCSLRAVLDEGRPELAWALRLGTSVARGLSQLHGQRIVHKDINPTNLVVDPASGEATIIDFDIASRLARETTDTWSTRALRGTLDYISPEQTGRTNRSIDHRTDLYSLGVTLYEVLTGRLPFELQDPVALVHHHIAVMPPAPHAVRASIPEPLSRLVMRLMAKTPEQRYQTAAGALADLARCAEELARAGTIAPFPLGSRDVPASLQISERLYGRGDEIDALLAAFRRAGEGRAELTLVGGYAGVGKTRLARELYEPITAEHGFFTSGKFDQVATTPYAALIDALAQLVRGVLAEPDEAVTRWRATLLEALGGAAQVIVDVLPELATVVGPQPPASPLPPTESRNRFHRVFQRFVRAFASPSHPLVLFLDDLQWADSASLELLQELLSDPNTTHLLVVGAFRDDEITSGHPLLLALETLEKAGGTVNRIDLQPLDELSIAELVADSLYRGTDDVDPLVQVVYARTRGNPFFVERLLKSVHADGALHADADAGQWVWDLSRIAELGISDNVADLMARRIGELPSTTRRVLQAAACVGNTFDLGLMSALTGELPTDVATVLWPAIEAELVRPVGQAWSWVTLLDAGQDPHGVEYRFVHDRIQEAAYSLTDEASRRASHVRIARFLLGADGAPDDQTLFEVVAQYNLGLEDVIDDGERLAVARLELRAGRTALESGAYRQASTYLATGCSLLPEGTWDGDHQLAFDLHLECAQADTLLGRFEEAGAGFDACLARAADTAAVVEVHCRRVNLLMRMSDSPGAVQAGLQGLAHFGFEAPDSPQGWQAATGAEMGALAAVLAGRDPATLVDAPECTDPAVLGEVRILAQIGTPAFMIPEVFGFINVRVVRLSIEHGHSADSPLACALYAFMLGMMGQFEQGEAFGRLALALNERRGSPAGAAPLEHLYSVFVQHWSHPLPETRETLYRARRLALDNGIYTTAGWVVMNVPWFAWVASDPLDQALDELWRHLDIAVHTLKHEEVAHAIRFTAHQLLELAGRDELSAQLDADGFSEDELFAKLAHFVPMLGAMRVQRLISATILGDHEAALADLPPAEALAPTYAGSVWQSEFAVYSSLLLLATAEAGGPTAEVRAKLDATLGQLQAWAGLCEHNHAWKRDLLAAELAALDGEHDRAAGLYDLAIEAAQRHGFSAGTGIACERAAAFFMARGKPRFARGYLSDAYYAYASWGAQAKVLRLEEHFPELRPRRGGGTTTDKGTTSKHDASGFLDLATVLKSTRLISRELVLEDLLKSLIALVIENAGAERGSLVLRRRDRLVVEARAEAGGEPQVLMGQELDEADVSGAIIRYAARSRSPVVLGDASSSTRFDQDPYVQRAKPRSVLATPILNRNELVGVLYLENNLATDAFTTDRCMLLDMISAQAAISIQNALLYRSLTRFVPSEFLSVLGRPSILDVELGDAVERDMALLFSDIRQFTTRAAGMSPQENFRFLNGYLRRVGPVIREHKGFVDKYIGDAVMALFPATVDDALRAALQMMHEAAAYSLELAASGAAPIEIGVSVHWGKMVLGTIGEERRIEGTVISDAVNTGSRLEDLTKDLHVHVIVSGEALEQVSDRGSFDARYLGEVVLRGRAAPTALYELFSGDSRQQITRKRATCERFEAAVRAQQAGDRAAARAGFQAVLAANPDDAVTRVKLEQLEGA